MGTETTDRVLHKLAHKLGLPLDEIVAKGQLPEDVAEKMAKNCKNCAAPTRCETFLIAKPDKIETPPNFCVNCRLLTFLSKSLPNQS
ncbi:DUF6455 family protein [Pseudorhodobacter sp. W20_MBD10_FR17]|uniref:DUF6455 family protein n=1 Tax=Pseudorhodobacter sp. W20_MBD10_FR17 TaxID=3240266 RepID=UPI003F9A258B